MYSEDQTADDQSSSTPSEARRGSSSTANSPMQPQITSSNSSSTSNNAKTGRKGDPRMHRAVEARVANPKISLFEALKVGGFEYPNDDDANLMDSEQITVGQRKNQLSRRIRLAHKQGNNQKSPPQCIPCPESTCGGNPMDALMVWPSTLRNSFHVSRNKRQFSLTEDDGLADDPAARPHDPNRNSLEEIREPSRLKAKDHPGFHPLVVPLLPPAAGNGSTNVIDPFGTNNQLFATHGSMLPQQVRHDVDARSSAATGVLLDRRDSQASFHSRATQAHTNLSSELGGPTWSSSGRSVTSAQHNLPSGVAITSLSQTAASIGMTLEQLALALRSSKNLAKTLLSSPTPSKSQQELAVALYQGENCALYQKAMLLAGYTPEVAQNERSPHYLQVALTAWQLEGQRLRALMNASQESADPPLEATTTTAPFGKAGAGGQHSGLSRHQQGDHNIHPAQHQEHSHSRQNGCHQHPADVADIECAYETGRHIHRLEGKCGHIPILHQPVGGTPHIDFVIGNRVECYQGVQPLSQDLLWPSTYSCEYLSCPETCRDDMRPKKLKDHEHTPAECMVGSDPIILDLSELDLDGNEWNLDVANGETLLGLFRLGDSQLSEGQNAMSSNGSVATTASVPALPLTSNNGRENFIGL